MRYLSICSGIEAASVAWAPLGWQAAGYSEIEAFPRAVLEHRFGAAPVDWDHRHTPQSNIIPLFGDFTKIEPHHVGPIDLLVGGTPCQSFSVAGKRAGLDDPRGHLTLEYLALAQRLRPRWLVWENVPGVLSDDGGRTLGTFLGLVGQLGYRWAYRVLDAQYCRVGGFGRAVPQRRRRVFVVGYLGDDARAAAVLFDRESLRGNPAPRRETGQGAAHDVAPSLVSSGRGVERGGDTRGQDPVIACRAVSPALKARDYKGVSSDGDGDGDGAPLIAHALRGEGFDASEDRTGRGTLIAIQAGATRENPASGPDGVGVQEGIAYTLEARAEVQAIAFDTTQITSAANYSNPQPGDPCHPLAASAHVPTIAFTAKDYGADASDEVSPTLRAGGFTDSHQNGGVMPAVDQPYTIMERGRGDGPSLEYRQDGTANAILTPNGGRGGLGVGAIAAEWAVRRLTPRECERLQGFPDDWTLIPWRKDQAPDGPRYKAIGNSMAVNVMRFIGERIAAVNVIIDEKQAA